jgi:acyl-coenzyme A synthetase/AMP-(fatty) acid ligase
MIRFEEILKLAQEVSTADLASAQQKVTSRDIVYILYTSGTTATPKGARLTHWNVCKNGEDIASYKMPKYFCFGDELPRTGGGKVKKSELRDRFFKDVKMDE